MTDYPSSGELLYKKLGKVIAIDYGNKRTGLATTDSLQIIATPLNTVGTDKLLPFLKEYSQREKVDKWVVGLPKQLNGQSSDMEAVVRKFINKLTAVFPKTPVTLIDERFTSKIAYRAIVESNLKKKDRHKKGIVDKISATLILQSYLDAKDNSKKNFYASTPKS